MSSVDDSYTGSEIANSELPVVIMFGAKWCSFSQTMKPIFENLANKYTGEAKFVYMDVDSTEQGKLYNVRGVPTFALVKQGKLVDITVGAKTIPVLDMWITQLL